MEPTALQDLEVRKREAEKEAERQQERQEGMVQKEVFNVPNPIENSSEIKIEN